jgi:mRNA-degrading endonuclease RelE of RelBE toxin-antitoxin system
MSYKIIPTEYFKQQVRLLQKDYPNIRNDLKELHKMLVENSKCGKSLGKRVYKIRLKNSDIQKGKRSGYRVISYVVDDDQKVRLLTIYAKSRKADISDDEILLILRKEGLIE